MPDIRSITTLLFPDASSVFHLPSLFPFFFLPCPSMVNRFTIDDTPTLLSIFYNPFRDFIVPSNRNSFANSPKESTTVGEYFLTFLIVQFSGTLRGLLIKIDEVYATMATITRVEEHYRVRCSNLIYSVRARARVAIVACIFFTR